MPLIKTIAKYIFYMEEFGTFQWLPTYPKIRMEILAFPGLDPACHSGLIMYPSALLTGQQLPTPPYTVNSTSLKNLIQSLFPHRNSFLASQPNHFALAYNLEQDNLLKSFVTYTYVIFLSHVSSLQFGLFVLPCVIKFCKAGSKSILSLPAV